MKNIQDKNIFIFKHYKPNKLLCQLKTINKGQMIN